MYKYQTHILRYLYTSGILNVYKQMCDCDVKENLPFTAMCQPGDSNIKWEIE